MADTKMLRLADLPSRKTTEIHYVPDAVRLAALAEEMDLSALRKMRLEGVLKPMGATDWQLDAHLGATVVQPCAVTLEPVTTRIEEPVHRQFIAGWEPTLESETEMDGDDVSEALPDTLDLDEIAAEALALAVPAFPRKPGAELEQTDFAAPGTQALTDETVKPFAGLAALKAKLEGSNDN